METIYYELTTLSSLIVSPRTSLAFYKDLDQFSLKDVEGHSDCVKTEKLKVIYPFYQYGLYESYSPDTAEYYLPGSSIKGALCQGTANPGKLMVDDVPIPRKYGRSHIVLRNIQKAQYLEEPQKAFFDVFFDHVAVEMVKADSTLEGSFNYDNIGAARELLKSANNAAKAKIGQMREYLSCLIKKEYPAQLKERLTKAADKLAKQLDDDQVLLLGGYKGLLHSMELKESPGEMAGAVYLDKETNLPHGLIKIQLNERP